VNPASWFARLLALAVGLPLLVFAVLAASPSLNRELPLPIPHFFIVTNVSLLAAGVALLVARAALRMEQVPVLLVAVGFMSMAALFSVHALATPGILHLGADYYDTYSGTVVGLSAYLSLFVPALLFAASVTAWGPRVVRRFPASPRRFLAGAVVLVVLYGIAALGRSDLVVRVPLTRPPYAVMLALAGTALYVFSARRLTAAYARTRFPFQGALAVAFLFLALAQIIMATSAIWTLAWWEYHVLMFAAVVLALGALFLELDRRRDLERFLPSEVVERVVAGDAVRLAGERRTVTVLFADLRGSTELAERMAPAEVVALLNEYVGAFARCVFAHGGMLDKFLGDGVMAVFGIVDDPTQGAEAAVRTALDIRRQVAGMNDARRRRGEVPIGAGVGIHTGEVVLGAVGIPQRSDYTAIGDTVNTAARLQGLSRDFKVDVLLSAETAARLRGAGFAFDDLGEATVRGRMQTVRVFTLR
jgi:class 3 adenylate cyclase